MTLLSEKQTSEYLGGIPVKTLQRWRTAGNGPKFVKVGSAVRYRQSDLDDFICEHVRQSTSGSEVA